jgi:hypothetical protein
MANKPYPQPSSDAPNRYSWADAELEPKQQHRFVAYMPVFMPRGIVTDAKELAEKIREDTGSNSGLIAAAKGRATSSDQIERVTEDFEKAVNATTAGGAISAMTSTTVAKSGILPSQIESILVPNQADFKAAFNASFMNTSRTLLHTRISPYIVKSFKPPSFGVNIVESNVPSAGLKAIAGAETTANVGRAQLSFVSTLQDDLHFSFLFLWYMGLDLGGTSGVKAFPLFNEAAIDGQIINESQKTLVIEEISADKNAAQAKGKMLGIPADMEGIIPVFDDANPDPSTGKTRTMMAPTIVGLHKLRNPMVTNVEFSPFSYAGTELVEVTVELTYRETQADFYSYETWINTRALGGDTRYQNSRGDGYSARPGEQEISNRFNYHLRRGYANYPRAALDSKNLMGKEPLTPLHKIMANIGTATTLKYELRRQMIKNAMESGNPRYINEMVTRSPSAAEDARQGDLREQARLADIEETRREDRMTRSERREVRRDQDLRGQEHRAERQRLGQQELRQRRQDNRAARRQSAAVDQAARSLPDSAYDVSDIPD